MKPNMKIDNSMKLNFVINNFALFIVIFATLFIFSCTKERNHETNNEITESLLTLNITAGNEDSKKTKATGSSHGVQSDDNYVETLEIFVFRNDGGVDNGQLDAYKKFSSNDGLTNLQIKTTTGSRIIYAVANSHRDNWNGITTLERFKSEMSSITLENVKKFTMAGSSTSVLHTTSSITFSISRLVSRIKVDGIKTAFAGTPYSGMTLSGVKVYLTNVIAAKSFAENSDMDVPPILNYKKSILSDSQSCAMPGMIFESIAGEIGDAGFTQPLYFYAYENLIASETPVSRYTRIVIEALLNGKTYYYPISINREGFGYVSENGHKGVKRNTAYQLKATIFRPGSTDPDKPLEPGTLSATLGIEDYRDQSNPV